MSNVSSDYTTKTFLHGAWVSHTSSKSASWKQFWTVLRDNILYLFQSQQECLETLSIRLHLSNDSTFHYGKGDPKNGFKFDLHLSKRKYRFKVNTVYEREVWRAYLEGVISVSVVKSVLLSICQQGTVPKGVVLSPEDAEQISEKIRQLQRQSVSNPKLPSALGHSPSVPSLTSPERDGVSITGSHQFGQRRSSVPSTASAGTESSSGGEFDLPERGSIVSQHSSGRGSDCSGGPFMIHKFNKEGTAETPSWFFHDCTSRDLAEKILTQCPDKGNTLMRVCTDRNTGSYAISKRLIGSGQIVHYEVIRVTEGYKISVDNCPGSMATLSEVMDCFIKLAGPTTTHPLTCNSLQQLGFAQSHYHPHIVPDPGPQESSSIDSDDEESYEVPVETPRPVAPSAPPPVPTPLTSLPKTQSKTWGREKIDEFSRQSSAGGFAPKTCGPADRKYSAPDCDRFSVMYINQRMQENNALERLDTILKQEGQTEDSKGTADVPDRPPPLPSVPANRPKLNVSNQPIYQNAASCPDIEDDVNSRWRHRSLSVPARTASDLDKRVPGDVLPPAMVRPESNGAKVPPPTAPKNNPRQLRASSVGSSEAAASVTDIYTMPIRRTSAPVCRPHHHHQRWSSQHSTILLPLPPDCSGSSGSDFSSDDEFDDNSQRDDCHLNDDIQESRKMSLQELSQAMQTLENKKEGGSNDNSVTRLSQQQGRSWQPTGIKGEESDCLSYCEIMIGSERASTPSRMPKRVERSENMTYSEIQFGPEWTENSTRDKEAKMEEDADQSKETDTNITENKKILAEAATVDREAENDVYYLNLLGEDEVIFDLMYASGQGSIEFWPPQGLSADSSSPGSSLVSSAYSGGMVMKELQQKLLAGFPQLKHVNKNASPNSTVLSDPNQRMQSATENESDEQLYEEFNNEYQNVSSK